MQVCPLADAERAWVTELCRGCFGGETIAARGVLHHPARLPGLVAWEGGCPMGALSFREEPGGAEVVLLAADPPGRGAGTALLTSLGALGRDREWRRLRLFTTNDNTQALRFFQRRGWDLVGLHLGAVERDRQLKPEIPEVSRDGIPLRHLLELEYPLGAGEAV